MLPLQIFLLPFGVVYVAAQLNLPFLLEFEDVLFGLAFDLADVLLVLGEQQRVPEFYLGLFQTRVFVFGLLCQREVAATQALQLLFAQDLEDAGLQVLCEACLQVLDIFVGH